MGEIKVPFPVVLIFAVCSSFESAFSWARQRAETQFGEIVLESEMSKFDQFTNYYTPTMGANLQKQLWAFRQTIDPAELPAIKQLANQWESEFETEFRNSDLRTNNMQIARPLNLDPGYVDLGKLILASTKDHAHRIYLSGGIFAETTLIYRNKKWESLPWSYPDYKSQNYQNFLTQCREFLKNTR
jgi:hypothetical protein